MEVYKRRIASVVRQLVVAVGLLGLQTAHICAEQDAASAEPGVNPALHQAQIDSQETPEANVASTPGTFEVDEEAAERALERTLTQVGALLLPFRSAEFDPSFIYIRREEDFPSFLTEDEDEIIAATTELRTNVFQLAVDLRVGLPWDSQLELSIPVAYEERSTVTLVGLSEIQEETIDAIGLGDLSIGLAKTVLREGFWWPDLIARVEWNADTGQQENGIVFGDGFNQLTGSLTALKRQDPLAFVGSFAYRTAFEQDNIEPGDEFSFSVGAVLAASPSTSLDATFQQSFSGETEVDGQTIPGSDQVSGVFSIGASSILGRGVLLSLTGGIGLTDDAPDYFINLSLPIRFGLPFL